MPQGLADLPTAVLVKTFRSGFGPAVHSEEAVEALLIGSLAPLETGRRDRSLLRGAAGTGNRCRSAASTTEEGIQTPANNFLEMCC